jgi:putative ABC transport system permease protein
MFLLAFQVGSDLVGQPAMASGRWLQPEDENAIVVDAILRKDEPDIQLGDEIILKIDGRERRFKVVGFSLGIIAPIVYANYPYITRITDDVGQTSAVAVSTTHDSADFVSDTNSKLGDHLERTGFRVSTVFSMSTEREEGEAFFSIIISLLLVMALLLALVGGLGLMGTMSINVLERTREIGVLRAIGASNREVAWVFIREGIAIGLLSWGFGAVLAFPLGKGLSDAVGVSIMGVAQPFAYSVSGLLMWLALVIVLSAIASLLPARNASRLTVREVLAYE